jgi:hypothetical protein
MLQNVYAFIISGGVTRSLCYVILIFNWTFD